MEDMADAGELECIVVELDGESSSGPSDLDSTDFSDIEELNATFNLGFHQPELADRQEPNTPPIKSRPARQGKPTAKVIQRRQKKTPKNPRARSSKEKNPLPKTSVRAKAFANILPSKPRQPRAAARASGKKKNVEEEDELDDIRPETDLGLGIVSIRSTAGTPGSLTDTGNRAFETGRSSRHRFSSRTRLLLQQT